ncbi:MAG: aspartate carbamoyltransferase catalytic subunit [Erysipelotrichaceae bacterium]
MNLFTMQDLSNAEIMELIQRAKFFASNKDWTLPNRVVMANLFFEPSTRTQYSFEMAMHGLGIDVTSFNANNSSLSKGESLYDTVKTFEALGYDGVVIRHPETRYFEQLENIKMPMINGGDGSGNHPSQCLLDLYTIYEEFERFEELRVVIVGDIKHSRVAKSNYEALTRLGANVVMSGPAELQDPQFPYLAIDEAIAQADVVMLLRIQLERHSTTLSMSKEMYLQQFGLNIERANAMQPHAIIMHPAPMNRDVEIADAIVESKQSRIFKQMENGVYMRKAMIEKVLGYAN